LPTGELLLKPKELIFTVTNTDAIYTIVEGDTLSGIAYKVYVGKIDNPEKYWWVIAKVNQIHNPFDLVTGTNLYIPNPVKFGQV
jgi:nucleoid-associated protein YgaU